MLSKYYKTKRCIDLSYSCFLSPEYVITLGGERLISLFPPRWRASPDTCLKHQFRFIQIFTFLLTTSVCLFLERYKYAPGDVRYLRENEELEQIITLSPNTTIFSGKLYS